MAVWIATAPVRSAAESLQCGVPVTRTLASGASHTYEIGGTEGTAVVVDAVDVSDSIGWIKLGVPGVGETCSGSVVVRSPSRTTVSVSDCIDHDAGEYTIVANIVSDDPQHCGQPMPCGLSPHVRSFGVSGQVDAYTFEGERGDRVTLTGRDVAGNTGGVTLRLFDPAGMLVTGGDTCADTMSVRLAMTGTHTVLVSACGLPHAGSYGIGFQSPQCPSGPDITYFGIARSDGMPLSPTQYDSAGRPVYATTGSGIFVVIEGRPGPSALRVGRNAFAHDPADPTVLPDLQMLLSQPLGDGSVDVCDKVFPDQGGVPSVYPFAFNGSQTAADAINDFGCRVNDGTGSPLGVDSQDACTFFPDGEYRFVDRSSTIQFCTPMAGPWAFAPGDTLVKARLRDIAGNLGPEREIVVRFGAPQPAPAVNDLAPGPISSAPESLTRSNGRVFFSADDATSGRELWRSDGSEDGTVLVHDIRPGPEGSSPAKLTRGAGLLFTADDGLHGVELWSLGPEDATPALVKDINPGPASASPGAITPGAWPAYFAADDGTTGVELWMTDGTESGTVLVKDINPGAAGSSPSALTTARGGVFFAADDGRSGRELWTSDGTEAGTVRVADIRSGPSGSAPAELIALGDTVFFTADDGVVGRELWKSNTRSGETALVKDIRPGSHGASPTNLTVAGKALYFTADDGTHGAELWRSDGTESGTVMVADIRPGPEGSIPTNLTQVGRTVFFAADDGLHGRELWRSTGAADETAMVKDIMPGGGSSSPTNLLNAGGTLVFAAADDRTGVEPWKSDGTVGGTLRLGDIALGSHSSHPGPFAVAGRKVFFVADDRVIGRELRVIPLFPPLCPGDCNSDGEVTVDELVNAVTIVLGTGVLDRCPAADPTGDGEVTVDKVIRAVNAALGGCPD